MNGTTWEAYRLVQAHYQERLGDIRARLCELPSDSAEAVCAADEYAHVLRRLHAVRERVCNIHGPATAPIVDDLLRSVPGVRP